MSHSAPPTPPSGRPPGGVNRDERRRRLRAAQAGQPVQRATVGVTHQQQRIAAEASFARRKRRNTIMVILAFLLALGLLVSLVVLNMPAAHAEGQFTVKDQSYVNKFPSGLQFNLQATSADPIKSATLQYTVDSGDGVVSSYGRPDDFTPSTEVNLQYFRDNKKAYLPPGTTITYHWDLEDTKGDKFSSDDVKFLQDDPRFKWQSISKDGVTAYWYAGNQAFGQSIVDTTLEAIDRLSKKMGITYSKPMMVWAYNSKQDMDPALQPRGGTYDSQIITLGQRTTATIMLLMANHPQYKDTIAHETGHMVVHQLADGPLAQLPSWLDEGLAMNAQPTIEPNYAREIELAKQRNNLMTVRTMSGVANDPQGVDLFYGEAYSVVKYLVDTYGQDKMVTLLKTLKDGADIDKALTQVYNLNEDTLDDAWRASIGAQPLPADKRGSVDITPIAVPSLAPMTLPQSSGSSSSNNSVAGSAPSTPPAPTAVAADDGSMLFKVGIGLVLLAVIAGVVMLAQGMMKKRNV